MNSLIYVSSPYLIFIILWLIVVLISKRNTRNFQRYMMKKYNWSKSEFASKEKVQRTAAINRVPFLAQILPLALILATIIAFIVSWSLLLLSFSNYSSACLTMIIILGLDLLFIGPSFFYAEKKRSTYRSKFAEFNNKKRTPLYAALVPTIINLISLLLFILIRIQN